MVKSNTVIRSGEYSDRDIIELLNKYFDKIPREEQKKLTIHGFNLLGRTVQDLLKTQDLPVATIQVMIADTLANPPIPPTPVLKPTPVVDTPEVKLEKENVSTSKLNTEGKEVIQFTEKGMNNLHSGDNPLFKELGEDKINGHEDDGRIFKTAQVKRLSDSKVFSYEYVWHSDWPTDFQDNKITEV